MNCARCSRPLVYDECGLNRKYHAGTDMLCISCLADALGVTEARLQEKIEEFRKAGCLYFSRRADTKI